ncbi:MAG TPA: sulfotransferase [Caulobacteraceae bacterium]|nr:sulfotransferase [Caulobacteraceae bacterium]
MPEADALASASPVVLLGRGGSGTRLLSALAAESGLFIGNRVSDTGDSLEWVDVIYAAAIEWLSGTPDGSWPDRLRAVAAAMLVEAGRRPHDLWGWKLPETVLALPAVRQAFPRARYVHLIRHPLASAFRRSHLTSRTDNAVGRAVLARAYAEAGRDAALVESDPEWLRNAITWRLHMDLALDALAEVDPARVLTIRFEDLVGAPAAAQARFRALLQLPQGASDPLAGFDAARAASTQGTEADADCVWRICAPAARRLGYERA